MTEIELKAHVDDRKTLTEVLDKIASYQGCLVRDDCYWGMKGKKQKKLRIRRESGWPNDARSTEPRVIVTYKHKELRTDSNGCCIEVNDEKESSISSAVPLELFLRDSGFEVLQKKHKEVMEWTMLLDDGDGSGKISATLELCNVPPLGDFLEIEILADDPDENQISIYQSKLEYILDMTGIPRDRIERRYYNDMLREAREMNQNGGN
ncbi:MAG: hypothetical protein ILP07_00815 [Treponema sp.]|nr:hypothetical protein [Treponema sp.]